MEKIKKHISGNYKFKFPEKLKIIRHKEKILVISPQNAKWIVLDNENQLTFLNLLLEMNIEKALEAFKNKGEYSDAKYVITQIIARNIEKETRIRASKHGDKVMHLYLTNKCNMRCPHCYMSAGIPLENELTTSEIKYILRTFKDYGGNLVTLSGGEVSTRNDIEEICYYAKSISLPIEILTNGIAWTTQQIKSISPCLKRVQISIDGYNEESNSTIRGKGSFTKSLLTVENFIQNGVAVEIAITPPLEQQHKNNINKYIEFAQKLKSLYKDAIKISFNGSMMDGREIQLSPKERVEYEMFIGSILEKFYGRKALDASFINTMKKKFIKDNCNYGNLSISANGDVYLCAFISTLKPIGNIRKDSFEKLFQISEVTKENSVVDKLIPCGQCELKYICGGDCRILHFPDMKNDISQIKVQCARECSPQVKENFYELMIRCNEALFE